MEKLKNFGQVTFNKKESRIDYSYFEKENGSWIKKHSQQSIQNEVYIPNFDALAEWRKGNDTGHTKDIFGNPILVGVPCNFYDRNPPAVIKKSERKFGADINPVVKFLAENFEFDPEVDEIPPLRIQYMDIETVVDNLGFFQAWNAGPDREGYRRGGVTLISSYDATDD